MKLGIIGAMDIEIESIVSNIKFLKVNEYAGRIYKSGKIENIDVVVVKSGIGMINASITTQILIDKFNVTHVINTGIAGSLSTDVKINDVVISTECIEHAMDVTSFGYKPGQIPEMDCFAFKASPYLIDIIRKIPINAALHFGRILSADKFVNTPNDKDILSTTFNGLCVEMEGAAIAHVCHCNKIDFCIIRSISDNAQSKDDVIEYEEFKHIAADTSSNIVISLIKNLSN